MVKSLAIGTAGMFGAVARWWLGTALHPTFPDFPWDTLAINLAGCWLIGCLHVRFAQAGRLGSVWKAAIVTGFLGSFTTFSTFGYEVFAMLQAGRPVHAALYAAASAAGGWLLVRAGADMAERRFGRNGGRTDGGPVSGGESR